jgi:hypothetical protein
LSFRAAIAVAKAVEIHELIGLEHLKLLQTINLLSANKEVSNAAIALECVSVYRQQHG